jgi:hypothetical protein
VSANTGVVFGANAGANKIGNAVDSDDVFIGTGAGQNVVAETQTFHTLVGTYAGQNVVTGEGGVAVGQKTANNTTNLNESMLLGGKAGLNLDSAIDDVLVGYEAGRDISATTLGRRIGIGTRASRYQQGDYGVSIGYIAGCQNVAGNNALGIISIGAFANDNLTNGDYDVAIGHQAGSVASTSGGGNVKIGYQTAMDATGRMVAIGRQAGFGLTDQTNLVLLGEQAGRTIPAGVDNVFVAGSEASGGNARIDNVFFGKGYVSTSPTLYTINGTGASGTDVAGADIVIAGGKATGNASGS